MTDQTAEIEEQTAAAVTEAPEPEETKEGETPEVETEASDETVVTFGDDEAPEHQEAPDWVKNVRKENRALNKQVKDLEKQLTNGKADEDTALGAEPTLESCEYEADKYRDSLREWDRAKAKQDAKATTAKEEEEKQGRAYDGRLSEYHDSKAAFDADQFVEAEDAVKGALSEVQQKILVHAFGGKAALLVRGLGQDEKRLKELAAITDHIDFAVAATRLESDMKVSQRKPKTVPTAVVKGNSTSLSGGDKTLEKLRDAAAKSGDLSEVVAYKRKLKAG